MITIKKTLKLFFTSYSMLASTTKVSYPKPSYQLYNQNLTFDCGDITAKFVFNGPYYLPSQSNKIILKTKKCLSFRCIENDNIFKKGSTYGIFDFNLQSLRNFVNASFSTEFLQTNNQEWIKIRRLTPQQIQQRSQKKRMKQKSAESLKTKQKDLQQDNQKCREQREKQAQIILQIEMKTPQKNYIFQMQQGKLELVRKIIKQSYPSLYGIDTVFEMQLENLIQKLNKGEIEDQYEMEERNFSIEGKQH